MLGRVELQKEVAIGRIELTFKPKMHTVLYGLDESRFPLEDNYRVGFESEYPDVYPAKVFGVKGLSAEMDAWIKEDPICGYYRMSSVSPDKWKNGDLLAISMIRDGKSGLSVVRYCQANYLIFKGEARLEPVTVSMMRGEMPVNKKLLEQMKEAYEYREDKVMLMERQDNDIINQMIRAKRREPNIGPK